VLGLSRIPPFAIATEAVIICSAVTRISCPIATVGFVLADHFEGSLKLPGFSPGDPIPVFSVKPKLKIRE